MHPFNHLSRQLRRAKGAGHIAAPHRRQVVGPLVEFRQRGDKHGGSAGYGGSAVSLHSGEKIRRAKTLNNHRFLMSHVKRKLLAIRRQVKASAIRMYRMLGAS